MLSHIFRRMWFGRQKFTTQLPATKPIALFASRTITHAHVKCRLYFVRSTTDHVKKASSPSPIQYYPFGENETLAKAISEKRCSQPKTINQKNRSFTKQKIPIW